MWASSWNFGPRDEDAVTACTVAESVLKHWGGGTWRDGSLAGAPPEANYLKLDCGKARQLLGWRPVLTLDEAIAMTVAWYRAALKGSEEDPFDLSRAQLRAYEQRLAGGTLQDSDRL